MATPAQVTALTKLHGICTAAQRPGLNPATLARLGDLSHAEVQRNLAELRRALPPTDAQLAMLWDRLGGLDSVPALLEARMRESNGATVGNLIAKLVANPGYRAEVFKAVAKQQKADESAKIAERMTRKIALQEIKAHSAANTPQPAPIWTGEVASEPEVASLSEIDIAEMFEDFEL